MDITIREFKENEGKELTKIYKESQQSDFSWLNQNVIKLNSFDKDTEGEFIEKENLMKVSIFCLDTVFSIE